MKVEALIELTDSTKSKGIFSLSFPLGWDAESCRVESQGPDRKCEVCTRKGMWGKIANMFGCWSDKPLIVELICVDSDALQVHY